MISELGLGLRTSYSRLGGSSKIIMGGGSFPSHYYASFKFTSYFRHQKRHYHSSITDFPKSDHEGVIDFKREKYMKDLLSTATVSNNCFWSADVGPLSMNNVNNSLLEFFQKNNISLNRVTQIARVDKAKNVTYMQNVRNLLSEFDGLRALMIVGGSSAEAQSMDRMEKQRIAMSLMKAAKDRGIPVGAVANIYAPYDQFVDEINMLKTTGVDIVYTQPVFGMFNIKTLRYLEDLYKRGDLDICVGMIYANATLYKNRMTDESDDRQLKKNNVVVDKYMMREFNKNEKSLSEKEAMAAYNKENLEGFVDWALSAGLGANNVYTRANREGFKEIVTAFSGTQLDFAALQKIPTLKFKN